MLGISKLARSSSILIFEQIFKMLSRYKPGNVNCRVCPEHQSFIPVYHHLVQDDRTSLMQLLAAELLSTYLWSYLSNPILFLSNLMNLDEKSSLRSYNIVSFDLNYKLASPTLLAHLHTCILEIPDGRKIGSSYVPDPKIGTGLFETPSPDRSAPKTNAIC